MRTKGTQQSSRLMKIITIPIRILAKARDLYVESMNSCADGANYGNYMGLPATMPRSFSVSSGRSSSESEDLQELIRSASASAMSRSNSNSNNNNNSNKKTGTMSNGISGNNMRSLASVMDMNAMKMGSRRMPRSCSVGMSKIDEDRPCEFGNEELGECHLGKINVVSDEIVYPRSRSYAVSRRNVVF